MLSDVTQETRNVDHRSSAKDCIAAKYLGNLRNILGPRMDKFGIRARKSVADNS